MKLIVIILAVIASGYVLIKTEINSIHGFYKKSGTQYFLRSASTEDQNS